MEVSDLLLGPKLVERNVFRLAEMPTDCNPRDLDQRLKMLGMSSQLEGVEIPVGPACIARPNVDSPYDELKGALENAKDPLHRLLHEFCWYWPPEYADEDEGGWAQLLAGHNEDAKHVWQASTSLSATHNLAVLFTLEALDAGAEQHNQAQGDEKLAQWQRAMTAWQSTFSHSGLDQCLTRRISNYNDARFTIDTYAGLREALPGIVISMPAGRLVNMAASYPEQASELRLLLFSNFNVDVVQSALERASKVLRDRLRFLHSSYDNDIEQNLLAAPKLTAMYAEQSFNELNILATVFGEENPFFVSMADGITDSLLVTQVSYGKKTQDWASGIGMLEAGLRIVRSDVERNQMQHNKEALTERLEVDNDWVGPGYWQLSEAMRAQFEVARAYTETQSQELAISHLRDVLIDAEFDSEPVLVCQCARHCLAFAFRRHAIEMWNAAMDEKETETARLVDMVVGDNMSYRERRIAEFKSSYPNRGIPAILLETQGSEIQCHMCGTDIFGEYFTSTVGECSYDLCRQCHVDLQSAIDKTASDFEQVGSRALSLQKLAQALNPHSRHVKGEIKTLEESDTGLSSSDVVATAIEWQLLDLNNVMDLLVGSNKTHNEGVGESLLVVDVLNDEQIAPMFEYMEKMLPQLTDKRQEAAILELFVRLVGRGASVSTKVMQCLLCRGDLAELFARYCLEAHREPQHDFWMKCYEQHPDLPILLQQIEYAAKYSPAGSSFPDEVSTICLTKLASYSASDIDGNPFDTSEIQSFLSQAVGQGEAFCVDVMVHILLGQLDDSRRALPALDSLIRQIGTKPILGLLRRIEDELLVISTEHLTNLLCACMWLEMANVQAAALGLAERKLQGKAGARVLIIGMGVEKEKIRNSSTAFVEKRVSELAESLLQAMYSDNAVQRETIIALLTKQSGNQWLPSLESMFAMALTLPYENASGFIVGLIRHHHADWPKHEMAKDFLGWMKTAKYRHQLVISAAARSLRQDFNRTSLFARFTTFGIAAKSPPVTNDDWWSMEQSAEARRQARMALPVGFVAPQNHAGQCPCGSGKRYENCHGLQ